jgi:cbb3-type cytochrome oxidase subunit 1
MLWPLGFGATLYFLRFRLPHALWNRWWQGALAVAMAAAAPLAGLSVLAVESPPRGLIEAEFVATALFYSVVLLLMASFALALRSAMRDTLEPPPWPSRSMIWFAAGWVAMAVHVAQEFLLVLNAEYREAVRFTDWTAGRQHLLLLLGLGSWAFGCLDELWPELRRSERWRMPLLADLHLVLTLVGGWMMAGMLFTAGWVQAGLVDSMVPWIDVVEGSAAFWLTRMAAGMAIFVAQVLLLINFVATRDRTLPELRRPRAAEAIEPELVDPDEMGELLR